MRNEWYNIPKETKVNAYTQVAESAGIPTYAVEKDWWVIQILAAIYKMDAGKHMIFKGGTSLSKAWNLIQRFSEDIDLALDRNFIGFTGEINRSQIKKYRKETGKYISENFCPELANKLKGNGLTDITLKYVNAKASDADPVQVEIIYPNVIDYTGYIQPRVLLEISISSLKEPNEISSFYSFLDEYYFESSFAGEMIEIPTAIPERTFLEKIFLLHEEFQRPQRKIRTERYSRHLYDLYQLIQTEHAENAIHNKELYQTIVEHRHLFFNIGGVDYNLHNPQTINPIPIPEFYDEYMLDYRTMQVEMIYGDSPAFGPMIDAIKEFVGKKINSLDWKMDKEFPKPKNQNKNLKND
ncbi:MAG: nucleotidyl transferase AbiEii/AbiGii toxin family protein [Prolixibacteraceae bacterium]|nr:nucleotidyl transferase AbiEii/AbiGii toxin family protein [Prolixibacteraceae bacterium]